MRYSAMDINSVLFFYRITVTLCITPLFGQEGTNNTVTMRMLSIVQIAKLYLNLGPLNHASIANKFRACGN